VEDCCLYPKEWCPHQQGHRDFHGRWTQKANVKVWIFVIYLVKSDNAKVTHLSKGPHKRSAFTQMNLYTRAFSDVVVLNSHRMSTKQINCQTCLESWLSGHWQLGISLSRRLSGSVANIAATNLILVKQWANFLKCGVCPWNCSWCSQSKIKKGLVLKLDYEKVYDKVDWKFLEDMLIYRGFGRKWVSWIMSLVKNGSIVVRLNDESSSFFKASKGLRQGDPSPLSFLILSLMSSLGWWAKLLKRGTYKGLWPTYTLKGSLAYNMLIIPLFS
jgi:hypothetical protein